MLSKNIYKLSLLTLPISLSKTYCDYDKDKYNEYIGKTLTKKDFFDLFPNYKPLKIVRNDMTHNNYKYTIGLNKIDNFYPKNTCCAGGFYLTDEKDLSIYINFGENVANILLPDDTLIYLEENKIKVDKLIINNLIPNKQYFNNLSKIDKLEAIKNNGLSIEYINNPDKEDQLEAVKKHGYSIQYINNPDKEVQLEAVKNNDLSIIYINNPDKEVQLEAVKKYSYSIKYINNPDKEVQLEAVKKYSYSIEYINNPDKEVQLEAVKNNGLSIKYINNPDKEVQLEAVKNRVYI